MTDIVEKLRMDADSANPYCAGQMEMLDAADEIETLRQRVQNLEGTIGLERIAAHNDKETIKILGNMVAERDLELTAQKQEWHKAYDIGVTCKHQLAAERAISDKLENALKLADIQYMGCGGNLRPEEVVSAMQRVIQNALAELAAMRKGETE